jgi:hypothetical protein
LGMLRRGDTFPGRRRLGLFSSESSRLLCKSKKENFKCESTCMLHTVVKISETDKRWTQWIRRDQFNSILHSIMHAMIFTIQTYTSITAYTAHASTKRTT